MFALDCRCTGLLMPNDETLTDADLPRNVEDLICFGLYSTSHAMLRAYAPLLKPLGLTYPQYIVLTALWEVDNQTNKALSDRVMLDPGTLTPLLKRMEKQGLVTRTRGTEDERKVFISLTDAGRALRDQAPKITRCIIEQTGIAPEKLAELLDTLVRLRANLVG